MSAVWRPGVQLPPRYMARVITFSRKRWVEIHIRRLRMGSTPAVHQQKHDH